MRLSVRVFGLALLEVEASTEDGEELEDGTDSGTTTATIVGFTPSAGDQRWEQGAGAGEL